MKSVSIIFILLLSGCASSALETRVKDLAASKIAYDKANICCASYSEMEFSTLNVKGQNKLIVGKQFHAFNFDEGKSFFRAVELPRLSYEYSLNIETWQTDTAGFASSLLSVHYLKPTLLFLDENFNVVKKISELNLRYSVWLSTSGWETDIAVNEELAKSRYLIIYTHPAVVGIRNNTTPGDLTIMAGNSFVSVPVASEGIPANFEGIVNIEVNKI